MEEIEFTQDTHCFKMGKTPKTNLKTKCYEANCFFNDKNNVKTQVKNAC